MKQCNGCAEEGMMNCHDIQTFLELKFIDFVQEGTSMDKAIPARWNSISQDTEVRIEV